jgi:hypothetical protein
MKKIAILAVALVICWAAVLLFAPKSESPIPFEPEAWRREVDGNKRLRMVDDLKPKLMGIGKQKVEQLLGAPRKDVGTLYPGYEYSYLLGTDRRLLDEDGIWLCIKFEKDDRVIDLQVVRD